MKQRFFFGVITLLIVSVGIVPVCMAQGTSQRPALPDLSGVEGLPPGFAESFRYNRLEKMWPVPSTRPSFKSVTEAVDCDAGDSIQAIIDTVEADELKIDITGTCRETVTIQRNSVSLQGGGNTMIIGGVDIQDARGVTVRDLSVVNGNGINVNLGSAVELINLVSVRSSGNGIAISDSAAYAEGIVSINNPIFGIRVGENADLTLSGNIDVSNNDWGMFVTNQGHVLAFSYNFRANNNLGGPGIGVQLRSSLFFVSGTLTAENNALAGFFSQIGSISAFSGNTINVRNNALVGMVAVSQSAIVEGFNTIVATGNGLAGVALEEASLWTSFGGTGSVMNLSNNMRFGIRCLDGSVIYMRGPDNDMIVTGNPDGGIVIDNSIARFEGLRAFGNNDADLVLSFGGRASLLERTAVDDILCQRGGMVAEGEEEPILCESADEPLRLKMRTLRPLIDAPLSSFKTTDGLQR